jgi:hypothetical protein
MKLDVLEFIRRFMQHILPKGFVKVRHYGFLHSNSKVSIKEVREIVYKKNDKIIEAIPKRSNISKKVPICKKCGVEMLILRSRQPKKIVPYINTA